MALGWLPFNLSSMTLREHTIDAKGKRLGKVAVEAAKVLMGKNLTSFSRSKLPDVKVKVVGAGKLDLSERRLRSLSYKRYSGYPGGLRITSGAELARKKGYGELVRHAIDGMLPKNSLRREMMKRLTVEE